MKRVLVVDDEDDIREALAAILSEAGHDVIPVANGSDALRYLATTTPPPDLILLDLRMPVMDGATFLARLRRRPEPLLREIPVVVMTAGDEGPKLVHRVGDDGAPWEGAQGAIPKPFGVGALLQLVEAWPTTAFPGSTH